MYRSIPDKTITHWLPHLGVFYLLFTLLCTCARAPKTSTSVVGNVRYEEQSKLLTADLEVSPTSSTSPTLFGSAMPSFTAAGPGHFRGRRTLPFTSPIRFSVPCSKPGGEHCEVALQFSPPVADNLPDSINVKSSLRFQATASGLQETENLIVFFEPDDRSKPQRILLQGPTSSGQMTIPKEAMTDFVPGQYQIYLIKQQLHKDSLPDLVTSIQTEYFTRSVSVVLF